MDAGDEDSEEPSELGEEKGNVKGRRESDVATTSDSISIRGSPCWYRGVRGERELYVRGFYVLLMTLRQNSHIATMALFGVSNSYLESRSRLSGGGDSRKTVAVVSVECASD